MLHSLLTYRRIVAALLFCWLNFPAIGGSLRFLPSQPQHFDFADQAALPPTFGAGEFTLEFWVKPDNRFPVGDTDRGTIGQLTNWTQDDVRPYSEPGWWYAGNWLLDGDSRPNGFGAEDSREGSFSLQFYGGGRFRWMFADDADVVPLGKVWVVEAYPASSTPSLLDGQWHHVACIRRWAANGKALLELWIDGKLIASQLIPLRVNMRKFWNSPPHPRNPRGLGGWCWGSEVMTAWNFYFTQYEDYKGLLAELRFWDRARSPAEIASGWAKPVFGTEPGLVGYFSFSEGAGTVARDRKDPHRVLTLHNSTAESWTEEAPPCCR